MWPFRRKPPERPKEDFVLAMVDDVVDPRLVVYHEPAGPLAEQYQSIAHDDDADTDAGDFVLRHRRFVGVQVARHGIVPDAKDAIIAAISLISLLS